MVKEVSMNLTVSAWNSLLQRLFKLEATVIELQKQLMEGGIGNVMTETNVPRQLECQVSELGKTRTKDYEVQKVQKNRKSKTHEKVDTRASVQDIVSIPKQDKRLKLSDCGNDNTEKGANVSEQFIGEMLGVVQVEVISEDEESLNTYNNSMTQDIQKSSSEHSRIRTKVHRLNFLKKSVASTSFKCNLCSKIYTCKSSLIHHLKIHTKKYQCKECGRCCISRSGLAIHYRIHTGERPYACNLCTETFSSQYILNNHFKIHSKNYQCKECGKCFQSRTGLVRHDRIHTGEKPYCCKLCTKTFTTQSDLTRHDLVYTGKKKHVCGLCSRRFSQFGNLGRHIRTHTREKIYRCDKCSERFIHDSGLRFHKAKHH